MDELIQEVTELFDSILNKISNEHAENQEFLRIHSLFKEFSCNRIFKSGNHNAGKCVLEYMIKYLKKLKKLGENSQISKKNQKKKIIINLEKLKYLIERIELSFNIAIDDFNCLSDDHERKIALKQITTTIYVENKEKMHKLYKDMNNKAKIFRAVMYKTLKYNQSTSRDLMTGWLIIYYSIFAKKKANLLAKLARAEINAEKLASLWKLIDSKIGVKAISKAFFPIKINTMIFIPRLVNNVLDLTYNKIHQEDSIKPETNFTFTQDSEDSRIPVRILSSIPINKLATNNKKLNQSSFSNEYHQFEKIIIHIHGGGFIAMSTLFYQTYTRAWANNLNIPVFSIEYRLAPEYKFPAGLDDVWQVYTWIVENAHKYIGIEPKQIILVGDSAGANLAAALILKAISVGYRVPDGLYMVFPCLNLNEDYFSTRVLLSLEDNKVIFKCFRAMIDNYIPDNFSAENYLISPALAPQDLLGKFPKTEMLIPLKDPLAHDSFRFAEKLLNANVDLHITEYPELSHGGLPYKQFPNEITEGLKKLLT